MKITELDQFNLKDAVKFNDTLNPNLWDEHEQLKPEIREKLLQIAADFQESLGVEDIGLKDITLSGSNAAYTYTPLSDIDLHLVVDLPSKEDNEVYRELFDAKKYSYNSQHDIKIKGYPVELYVQDAREPHYSQGVYSVMNDKWVDVPKRKSLDGDDQSVKSKYESLKHQITDAIDSEDYEQLSKVQKKLKTMRQSGLEKNGEFGVENLAFKMLRNKGWIDRLVKARNEAKDRELSLAERNKPKVDKVYGFKTPEVVQTEGTVPAGQSIALRKKVIEFAKTFAPLPKLTFEARLNSKLGYDSSKSNKALIEWMETTEGKLNSVNLAFEAVYGVTPKEYCTRYKKQQLNKWTLRESKINKDDIVMELLDNSGVHVNLPKIGDTINVYQFLVDDILSTVDINILNHRVVESVNPSQASFATNDGERWSIGEDDLGATSEVCGWTEGDRNNVTSFLFLKSEYRNEVYNFKGWDINVAEDSHLKETFVDKWSRVLARVSEDVTNTWDGVSDSTQSFLNEQGQLPNENSLGQPIAQSEEALRNFWRWFGDSKVVDKQGRPQVRYHGTPNDFESFDKGLIFTAAGHTLASMYSFDGHAGYDEVPNTSTLDNNPEGWSPRVMPLYVRATKIWHPFHNSDQLADRLIQKGKLAAEERDAWIERMENGDWESIETRDIISTIKEMGYDGFNVFEGGMETLAVFSKLQIKSALGNSGSFKRFNTKITHEDVTNTWDGVSDSTQSFLNELGPEQGQEQSLIDMIADSFVQLKKEMAAFNPA